MLQNLNRREKSLILLMIGLFSFFLLFILFKGQGRGADGAARSIAQYQDALALFSGPDVHERMAERDRMAALEDQIANNDLQLRSFLERTCLRSGVNAPSQYNDNTVPMRDGAGGPVRIVEVETIARITNVQRENLSRLLEAIATAPELVVLKAVDVQPPRGAARDMLDVRLTLATYRLADDDS